MSPADPHTGGWRRALRRQEGGKHFDTNITKDGFS